MVLKNTLVTNELMIHRILFQRDFSNSKKVVLNFLTDQLTSLVVIDPSCGTGLFLHEIISLILHVVSITRDTIPTYKFHEILDRVFHNIFGYDIDSDNIILTKLSGFNTHLKREKH